MVEKNILVFQRISCVENMYLFTSPISVHCARMNILDERIIVEHDVDCALPGVFDACERKEAIKFIECLFAVFSYESMHMQRAYVEGRDARVERMCDNSNPYMTEPKLRDMWFKGYEDAGDQLIITDHL